jgi:hypothetical protein
MHACIILLLLKVLNKTGSRHCNSSSLSCFSFFVSFAIFFFYSRITCNKKVLHPFLFLVGIVNGCGCVLERTKDPDFRSSLKNRRARSVSLEINRLSVVKYPVSFCTSLMRAGGHMASIVLIFFRLASILQHETRKPRSLLAVTSNTHFSEFSLVRVSRNLSKTRARLFSKDALDLDNDVIDIHFY